MRAVFALLAACLIGTPVYAQDVAKYDGLVTIYALPADASTGERPMQTMKHTGSPFASKAECEAALEGSVPELSAAIEQGYGVTAGVDFELKPSCEVSGQPS